MNTNIWQKLAKNRPIKVLAPMEGVTDYVFRELVNKLAPADIYFTEFTSAKALLNSKARENSLKRLSQDIRLPLIAQLWGNDPSVMYDSILSLAEFKFDGFDINMGCPDKNVVKKSCGAGLINNFDLATKIIESSYEASRKLGAPLSVKTRVGYLDYEEEWLINILQTNKLAALTVHLRSKIEMSKVDAHYEYIDRIISLRDVYSPNTLIIVNGDIDNLTKVNKLYSSHNIDGAMLGRAILKNLLVFSGKDYSLEYTEKEQLELLKDFSIKYYSEYSNFDKLKRFFKVFIRDNRYSDKLRIKLYEASDFNEANEILTYYIEKSDTKDSM